MADNLTIKAIDGNHTVASDDISSVHYTRLKMVIGADGVNDGDVSFTNPLPAKNIDYSFGTEQSGTVDTTTAVPLFDGNSGRPSRTSTSRRIRLCNCSSSGGLLVRYGSAPTSTTFLEYLAPYETRDLDVKPGTTAQILGSGATITYLAQELS